MRVFNVGATPDAVPVSSRTAGFSRTAARRVGAIATVAVVASVLIGLPAWASPAATGAGSAQAGLTGAGLGSVLPQSAGTGVPDRWAAASVRVPVNVAVRPLVVSDLGYAEPPKPQVPAPSPARRQSDPISSGTTQPAARAAQPSRTRHADRDGDDRDERDGDSAAGDDSIQRSRWRSSARDRDRDHDLVAASVPDSTAEPGAALSSQTLAAALVRARADWAVSVGEVASITASIADLPGATLGQASGSSIVVDIDAAGWGWSRMDLLTVVRHEIGHVLGLDHIESGLMAPTLAPGEIRSVPAAPVVSAEAEAAAAAPEPAPAPPAAPESAPAGESAQPSDAGEPPLVEAVPQVAPDPDPGADSPTSAPTVPDVEGAPAEALTAPERTIADDGEGATSPAFPAEVASDPVELDAGSVSVTPAGPADRVTAALSWIVTDGDATLDVGDSLGISTVTYDAEHDVLRLNIADATADLPVEGLVRVTIVSREGTVTLTGEIRLTSTGLVVRARHVVVESGTTIDTRGALADGSITLEAIAVDDDLRPPDRAADDSQGVAVAVQATARASSALADASVTVTGARLLGGDITLAARSAASGGAEASRADVAVTSRASVGVLDSEIISSGDVTLVAESAAAAAAMATGDVTHADSAMDAAAASVRLVSTATSTLGGQSVVVADGVLSVLAKNSTDARSWGDASGATAGAGIATASVDRVTIAAIDGAGEGGITARRLDVSADSAGSMSVRSAASTGGATQNDVTPTERALSLASTPDSFVNVASALGEGRLNGQTHSYLASGGGRSLTVSTTEAQRVTARTTDATDVAADGSAAGTGAAVAVALRTLEARADLEGDVVLIAPEVVLDAGLERTASLTSAVAAATDAVAYEVARSITEAGVLRGSTLDVGPRGPGVDGAKITVNASSTTTDRAAAKRAASVGAAAVDRATVASDTLTRSWIADGAVLLGASDLTLTASSSDSATADAGESDANGTALVLLTTTTASTVGSGPALVLTGDLAVTADQVAVATAFGAEATATVDQERAAVVGREVAAAGLVSLLVNGTPVATIPAGALLVLDGATATIARSIPAGLAAHVAGTVGSASATSSVEPSEARPATTDPVEAPGPMQGSVPVEGVVVSAGTAVGGSGAHRDSPAVPVPAFSATAAVVARRLRLSVPAAMLGDLRLRSGRGPPGEESDPEAPGITRVSTAVSTTAVSTTAVSTTAMHYDGSGALGSPFTRVDVLDALTSLSEADRPAQSQALQPPAGSLTLLRLVAVVGAMAALVRSAIAVATRRLRAAPIWVGAATTGAIAGRIPRPAAPRTDCGAIRAVVVPTGAAVRPALDLVERETAVSADSVVRGAAIWGVGGAAGSCALSRGGSRRRGTAAGGLGSRVGRGSGGLRRGAGAAVVSVGGQRPQRSLVLSAAPSCGGPAAPRARRTCLGRSGPAGAPVVGCRARYGHRARTWSDVPNGGEGVGA